MSYGDASPLLSVNGRVVRTFACCASVSGSNPEALFWGGKTGLNFLNNEKRNYGLFRD